MEPALLVLAVILFAFLGSILGIVTGLTPGLHVNTVAVILVGAQGVLLAFTTLLLGWADIGQLEAGVLLASTVVGLISTHIFVDFIPSTFLAAPDPDTALSSLPAHRMVLRGEGFDALRLAAYGCFGAFLVALVLVIPLRLVMGPPVDAYEKLRPVVPLILLCVTALMIATEGRGGRRRGIALAVSPTLGVQALEEMELSEPAVRVTSRTAADHIGETVYVEGRLSALGRDHGLLVDDQGAIPVSFVGMEALEGEARVYGMPTLQSDRLGPLRSRSLALLLFLASGALGWVLLSYPILRVSNWLPLTLVAQDAGTMALFPLFTGLFGLPPLILGRRSLTRLPPQRQGEGPGLPRLRRWRAITSGGLAGALVGWFPGLSGAVATTVAGLLSRADGGGRGEEDDREMVVAVAGANAATALLTLVALFTILRPRSGGAAAIQELSAGTILPWEPMQAIPWALALFLVAAVVGTALGLLYVLTLGRAFVALLQRLPYNRLVDITLVLLVALLLLFSGVMGLGVAAVAAALGSVPLLTGVRRVHLMGALILPVVLSLWGT